MKNSLIIIVAQENPKFVKTLKLILDEMKPQFPNADVSIKILKDIPEFNMRTTKNSGLVFMEDQFLLKLNTKNARKFNSDLVLLFDGHFVGVEAFLIKKIIQRNSLNLIGHISLTNYPYDLIRLLVTDFITLKLYDEQENNS